MNCLNSCFYFSVIAMVMASLPMKLNAATVDCPVQQLEMPSSWTVRSSGGITTYQHRTGTQKLTAATYLIEKAYQSEQGRKTVMQKNAELSRATELAVNSKQLQVSALESAESRKYQQQLFFGYDPVSGRRFARFSVASVNCLQNFYYEATGQTASDFDRTAHKLFSDLAISARHLNVPAINTPMAASHRPQMNRELPLAISLPGL